MIDIFAQLDKKFDIINKTNNLCSYLNEDREFYFTGYGQTFFGILDGVFSRWELNNNFRDFGDMLEELELGTAVRDYHDFLEITFNLTNEEQCYKFLQLVMNAVAYLKKQYSQFLDVFEAIQQRVDMILQKVNISCILDENKKYYILVENKALVREIAERTNEKLAYKLYEYNAIDNKQNAEKKRSILLYLADYTEPITKGYDKAGDIGKLYKVLDFALNNCHVRHNNKEGNKKNNFASELSDEELVDVYDKIFDLFLQVLSIENTSKSLTYIEEIKDKFDQKIYKHI